jgi:hypothetical protein
MRSPLGFLKAGSCPVATSALGAAAESAIKLSRTATKYLYASHGTVHGSQDTGKIVPEK